MRTLSQHFTRISPGRAILLASALLAATGSGAAAQSTGAVAGRVTVAGSDRPLAGASILVDGARSRVETDADGRFRVANVAPGPRTIEARLIGYQPAGRSVTVTAGGTASVELFLVRAAQELTALTVIGTPTDLEET